MIIGHMTCWPGVGLKMVRSWVSLAQALAGSGNEPPAGSQRRVQCFAVVPEPPVWVTVSDTFAADVAAADEPPLPVADGAAALPQAAAASPHAAISAPPVRIRAVPCLS